MKPLLLSCALILTVWGLALSEPSPKAEESVNREPVKSNPASQPPQKNPTASQKPPPKDQRGTEKMPLVIKGIPSKKTPQQAEEDRKERDVKAALDRELTRYTGQQALFTFILIVVGSIQLGLFWWQLSMIRESLTHTKKAADAAFEEATAIKLAERAYVKLSHVPPGLGSHNATFFAQFRVRNFGRTPAKVTDVVVDFYHFPSAESVPIRPPHPQSHRTVTAFLVPQDEFFFPHQRTFTPEIASKVTSGEEVMLVCGHVDYIDKFGQRHRAGYAREYSHLRDIRRDYRTDEDFMARSNLDLVLRDEYNYDRKREIGEGFDWVWTGRPPTE